MAGILVEKTGGTEVLQYRTDLPVPVPKENEVLVKNDVIGINFIDIYFRTGLYVAPKPEILGKEGAGEVAAVGPGVTGTHIPPLSPKTPPRHLNCLRVRSIRQSRLPLRQRRLRNLHLRPRPQNRQTPPFNLHSRCGRRLAPGSDSHDPHLRSPPRQRGRLGARPCCFRRYRRLVMPIVEGEGRAYNCYRWEQGEGEGCGGGGR